MAAFLVAVPATADTDNLPNGRYALGTNSPVTFMCSATPDGTMTVNPDCLGYYDGWVSVIYLADTDGAGLFTGYWVTSVSGRSCDREIEGSPYWGRVRFQFDATADSWTGLWGFCDDPPDRIWDGWR